jgi:transposase
MSKDSTFGGVLFKAIAERLGVSWRTIYRWINEHNEPSQLARRRIREELEKLRAEEKHAEAERIIAPGE